LVDESEDYLNLLEKALRSLPQKTQKFERFEPPVPKIHLEGSKTIISNFSEICDKLRREPAFVAKFFGKELAVPTEITGMRIIFFSKIPFRLIEEKYNEFIKYYVICPVCKRPDTKIKIERKIQLLECEACGAITPIKK